MAKDLNRIRYVVEHYEYLQGGVTAFAGLGIILFGLSRTGWVENGGLGGLLVLLGIFAVLLQHLARKYYERAYGYVRPKQRARSKQVLLNALLIGGLLAVLVINVWLQPSVDAVSLVFVAGFLYRWGTSYGRGIFWLISAAVVAGLSLLPLATAPAPAGGGLSPEEMQGITQIIAGLLVLLGSLFDHLFLVRTFRPVQEENNGRAV